MIQSSFGNSKTGDEKVYKVKEIDGKEYVSLPVDPGEACECDGLPIKPRTNGKIQLTAHQKQEIKQRLATKAENGLVPLWDYVRILSGYINEYIQEGSKR